MRRARQQAHQRFAQEYPRAQADIAYSERLRKPRGQARVFRTSISSGTSSQAQDREAPHGGLDRRRARSASSQRWASAWRDAEHGARQQGCWVGSGEKQWQRFYLASDARLNRRRCPATADSDAIYVLLDWRSFTLNSIPGVIAGRELGKVQNMIRSRSPVSSETLSPRSQDRSPAAHRDDGRKSHAP